MKHTGIVILFFIGLIFFIYLNFMTEISWKELVAGYCLILIMLFIVVIYKQIEELTDKSESIDKMHVMLEEKLDGILTKLDDLTGKSDSGQNKS